jgi:hypothetical protein
MQVDLKKKSGIDFKTPSAGIGHKTKDFCHGRGLRRSIFSKIKPLIESQGVFWFSKP